jgi:hypothetical protein
LVQVWLRLRHAHPDATKHRPTGTNVIKLFTAVKYDWA